jgi:site-specific DNA recombinase
VAIQVIAAIYARKSTEQNGVADEQKSVTRQIEHAREYARRKGWSIDEECVFVDDGISGAEFANRPGFLRLMNALKPRPSFQALIMSEESRLGREAIETAYALKQLVQAGVRVFFYLEDRERTLDSPTDKIMLSLTAFADELEREKARQRTFDAMQRKARAGHLTGGRTFGYDNVDVVGPDGRRSHVTRRINPAEAAIVRRIFELYARGYGLKAITVTLNTEGAPAPRAQQGRPTAWAMSSVRDVLYRDLYRGQIVWNRTRKRNQWGQVHTSERPATDWIIVPAPELRIVSDDVWNGVHTQLVEHRKSYLRSTGGRLFGRPGRESESKYLLPGLARCAVCGGGFYVKSRAHGTGKKRRRAYFYGCTSFHQKGSAICSNSLEIPMERADDAVLTAFEQDVLQPAVVERAIRLAVERLRASPADDATRRATLQARVGTLNEELSKLAGAVAAGGEVSTLVAAIRQREGERAKAERELEGLTRAASSTRVDPGTIERDLRERLSEWRALLRRHVPQARQIMKRLLVKPLRFTPFRNDSEKYYEFTAEIALGRVFSGLASAIWVASPTGFEPVFWP